MAFIKQKNKDRKSFSLVLGFVCDLGVLMEKGKYEGREEISGASKFEF
jgi:hypothetical protein